MHHIGNMVRGCIYKRQNHSVRINKYPFSTCKKPVKLLKQGPSLHVGPSEFLPFQRELKKTKVSNDVIEKKHVMNIPPWLISIVLRSDEIKISKKKPVTSHSNMLIV
jgi:hypothetical protein